MMKEEALNINLPTHKTVERNQYSSTRDCQHFISAAALHNFFSILAGIDFFPSLSHY